MIGSHSQRQEIVGQRKVTNRFEWNQRCSGRKMTHKLTISRARMEDSLINVLRKVLKTPGDYRCFTNIKGTAKDSQRTASLRRKWWTAEFDFLWWADILNSPDYEQTDWSGSVFRKISQKYRPLLWHHNSKPAMVMLWAAITGDNISQFVNICRACKINTDY